MTQDAAGLEGTFQRAWALLVTNPIVVVPGLVMGAVALGILFLVIALFVGAALVTGADGSTAAGGMAFGIAALVGIVLLTIVAIAQTAFVTGMAGAAWARGTTTLSDGWIALKHRGGDVFVAIVLLLLLAIAAIVLAIPTISLSLWAFYVFFIYTVPAVIIGGHRGGAALSESCRIASRNFLPTLGVAAIAILVSLLGAAGGAEIAKMSPIAGGLLSLVVQQAALAYTTLIIVGEYVKLHPAQAAVPVAP